MTIIARKRDPSDPTLERSYWKARCCAAEDYIDRRLHAVVSYATTTAEMQGVLDSYARWRELAEMPERIDEARRLRIDNSAKQD